MHDEARADDLVQETWAAWVERRPRGLAEPRAWLARVLRNRAFNARRGDERRERREAERARADPGAPETDGTLEAQARLIEALRRLEEPYRSTLVQRYYHDLAPREIAERDGLSLNTVKARLARGLERLRAEMDRRYGGDRGAWCHWLMTLGNRAVPASHPAARSAPGSEAVPGPAMVPSIAGGSASLGGWLLCAAAALAALGWVLWRTTRPAVQEHVALGEVEVGRAPLELTPPRREPVRAEPTPRGSKPPSQAPSVAAAAPRTAAPPLPFEWPQFAGSSSHDNFSPFSRRTDLILSPFVLATYPGFSGQPTISGTDLYCGGTTLSRLDLPSGKLTSPGDDLIERIGPARGDWSGDDSTARRLARQGLDPRARVAAAPAVTKELVIVRFVRDGSVSGVDRDLRYEQWHWEPKEPAFCPLSGCLVAERYLAARGHEVVALSVINGAVDWRFDTGAAGAVEMVPASNGDVVFFATERGVVFCLDLARGKELWRVETGHDPDGMVPVAFADRVVLADKGEVGDQRSWSSGRLRALQSYDGRELWKRPCVAGFHPGVGEGRVFAEDWSGLRAISLETGELIAFMRAEQRSWLAGAPTVVGDSLYAIETDLIVRELKSGRERWRFQTGSALLDFVHTGDRIYVASSAGLVVIADDPDGKPVAPGFKLALDDGKKTGDPH